MSEVKRWDFVGGDGPGAYPMEEPDGRMVAYTDHVAEMDAAQSELAALREELVKATEQSKWRGEMAASNCQQHDAQLVVSHKLQQRLTAAEQRNANLLHTLRSALQGVKMVGLQDHLCDYALAGNIQAEIEAALFHQPTESGASE